MFATVLGITTFVIPMELLYLERSLILAEARDIEHRL